MRESVLTLLAGKGLIPETVREKIQKEQNLEQLKIWLQLAAKAENVEAFVEGLQERKYGASTFRNK